MAKKEKKQKGKKSNYFKDVYKEMKKVKFPSAKEVIKYSFATIIIVVFLIAFFLLLSAGLSWIKGVI